MDRTLLTAFTFYIKGQSSLEKTVSQTHFGGWTKHYKVLSHFR